MKTLAAIRTHKWGDDEQHLFSTLSPVFGRDLAVVYQNPEPGLTLPCDVIPLTEDWVAANGLSPIHRWGWQCGDYAYYRLREARHGYDAYWLIEPDVHVSGDASGFFSHFRDVADDVLGLRPQALPQGHRFGLSLEEVDKRRAIFALTRLTGRAIDRLFAARRAYCLDAPGFRRFANDEAFVFTKAHADPDLTLGDLEAYAPDWFGTGSYFDTDPDMLRDAIDGRWAIEGRLYHPVRGRTSFNGALAERILNGTGWMKRMKASIDELTDADIDEIADTVADRLRAHLKSVQSDTKLARELAASRSAAGIRAFETSEADQP